MHSLDKHGRGLISKEAGLENKANIIVRRLLSYSSCHLQWCIQGWRFGLAVTRWPRWETVYGRVNHLGM